MGFPYTSSLRRGYIVELLEKHGIFDEFKKTQWPLGNTSTGETKRRRFLRIKSQYEAFLSGRGAEPASEEASETADPQQGLEFALEAHLRDFLARNLERIEPGLRLYSAGDRIGIEFPIDGGRIDLLAIDGDGKIRRNRIKTVSRAKQDSRTACALYGLD